MSDHSNDRTPVMPAGWYDDPTSIGDARYWDGFGWTTSISANGVTATAAIEPALVGVPPVHGSEFRAQRPSPAPAPTPPPVTVNQSPSRSPMGGIVAAILGIAAVVALIVVLTRDDGGDNPPPNTDTPITTPATEAPATEPPATAGG